MALLVIFSCEPPKKESGSSKKSSKKYTITYELNGGTNHEDNPSSYTVKSETITLKSPTKAGFGFIGWFDNEACSGTAVTAITQGSTGNKTLYAKWSDAFVSINVGAGVTFTQEATAGSPSSFKHTITKTFTMAKYQVTYALWYEVRTWASSHEYSFANQGREGHNGTIGAAPTDRKYEPVTTVNWRDAIVWCNAYSEKEGLAPCYTYSGSVIKDSRDSNSTACDNAVCNWDAKGYRLPSEGEWEFAARYKDGSDWTPYNYASGATANYTNEYACKAVAWYSANAGETTHAVGGKDPNALGCYDMSGNVWEWCWDWRGNYPSSAQTNYRGRASGSFRIIRGGSWNINADYLRVGYRGSGYRPNGEDNNVGFRIAKTL